MKKNSFKHIVLIFQFAIIFVCVGKVDALDFSQFSKRESTSWFALERAKVYYEEKEYGESLNYVLDAIQIRESEVMGAKNELMRALNYEALRRAGDDIVRLQEKLSERNSIKALKVLDEIFIRKKPSDFDNSMQKLLDWLETQVEYPEALYLEGKIYAAEGEYSLAEQYYRRAVACSENFDVPEEKYSLLYTVAEMDSFTGNYEQQQKVLLMIVSDDRIFGLPGKEPATLRAMKQNLDDKSKTTDSFFMLYRHSAWFALKAYDNLAEYFFLYEDGMQERAFTCSLLAASIVVTKLADSIEERQVAWKYSSLSDLLSQAVKDVEIRDWMQNNSVWRILYRLADIIYQRGNIDSAKNLYRIIAEKSTDANIKIRAFNKM